ncbi:MAG: type 1 glutamine amidotransferase [Inhella sp.]
MKPIAILQHERTQGPGFLLNCLESQGWACELIEPGDERPWQARDFAGIVVLGSDASVHDGADWIEAERQLLRRALVADVSVLGHCFGAQLLAQALGARVQRNPCAQIGWQCLGVTPAARALFGGQPRVWSFNWHYEGFEIPRGAQRTLFGAYSLNKGFALGPHLGLQGHLQITAEGVAAWCAEAREELARAQGPAVQSEAEMLQGLALHVASMQAAARQLYQHWASGLQQRQPRAVLMRS